MLINQDYVIATGDGVDYRVLEDKTIVGTWISSQTDSWQAPYTIKKSVSTNGGTSWTTTNLGDVPVIPIWWSIQAVKVDYQGNIHYVCSAPSIGSPGMDCIYYGKHNGTSWNWEELNAMLPFYWCNRMWLDSNNNPLLWCGHTDNITTGLVSFNGQAWVNLNANGGVTTCCFDKDDIIHALSLIPNDNRNEWGQPYEYITMYSKFIDGAWTTPVIVPIQLEIYSMRMLVDFYGNMHLTYNIIVWETYFITSYFVTFNELGELSFNPIKLSNTDKGGSDIYVEEYSLNQKIYYIWIEDNNQNYKPAQAYVRIYNTKTNTMGNAIKIFEVNETHYFSSIYSFAFGSNYNSWGIAIIKIRLAQPQIQELHLFMGAEESVLENNNISDDFIVGGINTYCFRVLSNKDIVGAWISTPLDSWSPPYAIKKAISTNNGFTWNIESIATAPVNVENFNSQTLGIDAEGNIHYACKAFQTGVPGNYVIHYGKYTGVWTWEELIHISYDGVINIDFDSKNNPVITTVTSPDYVYSLIYFNGVSWEDLGLTIPFMCSKGVGKDDWLHVIYIISNGHLSEWGYPDQFLYYYIKKRLGEEAWTEPIHLSDIPIATQPFLPLKVDQYNNIHYTYSSVPDDYRWDNYYIKISSNGDISSPIKIGDGTAYLEFGPGIGTYYSKNKAYFIWFDGNESWQGITAKLRVFNVKTATWENRITLIHTPDDIPGYFLNNASALIAFSNYTGWITPVVAMREAYPQLQKLYLFINPEEPKTFVPIPLLKG
jgi:hypothetical protein